MRIPRIYTSQALSDGAYLRLSDEPAHHVHRVLRLKPGADIIAFNGDGREFPSTLAAVDPSGVWLQVHSGSEPAGPPALSLTLLQGIAKGERMDLALQKAVELGAEQLIPVFCERTVVRLEGARLGRRMGHWRKIVIAACEQSGRARVPVLSAARKLENLCQTPPPGLKLVLHPRGSHTLDQLRPERQIALLTGPEGGLTQEELARAQAAGFLPVRLGPRILRTETATLAAISALQALWGDFRD